MHKFKKALLAVPVAGAALASGAQSAFAADAIASASSEIGKVNDMVESVQGTTFTLIIGFFGAALLVFAFGYVMKKSRGSAR